MISDDRHIPSVANHGMMKNHNLTRFMQTLRRHAPISRADISRLTGLDKKCVSMFSGELIEASFIRESGIEAALRGRPGCLLDFVPGQNYSLGLAVQADRINCVAFEFPGKLAGTAVYPLEPGISRDDLVSTIRRATREMSGRRKVKGVGISFPGTVDLRKGVIHSAANLACLNKFRFREPFQKLGLGPVWFEQSSRAAALAESWFGYGATAGNFANIEVNTGISAVMVNRNRLYHGPEGFVGELGHVIVQPRGRLCRCGNRGCLEAYLGESALKAELDAAGVSIENPFPPGGGNPPGDAELHPGAVKVFRSAGVWLARGLGAIVNLFNPDSIIIQGGLMRYADIILPAAQKELVKCCLAEKLALTSIAVSTLPFPDAMGAAALAFPGWFKDGYDYLAKSELLKKIKQTAV